MEVLEGQSEREGGERKEVEKKKQNQPSLRYLEAPVIAYSPPGVGERIQLSTMCRGGG